MALAHMRKALVPLAVAGVMAVLTGLGFSENMTLVEALDKGFDLVITAILVYLIPNKSK